MSHQEGLLDKIEEIGTVTSKLSSRERVFRYRIFPSTYGLYVQNRRLSGGAMQYMAGGKFLKKLVFVREVDGSRKVMKYEPGDWELKVDETLSFCRVLERASKGQTEWTEEKFEAYWAEEKFDPAVVAKVDNVWQEHDSYLNKAWQLTNTEQRNNLAKFFRSELEQEWPTEFLEMMITLRSTTERFINSIKMAYVAGYMVSKGWISIEELADFNLCLGDNIATHIRSVLREAESRGTAFASAFARVAAEGTQFALSTRG